MSQRSLFVHMDEFYCLIVLIEDAKPIDYSFSRNPQLDEIAFRIEHFVSRLGIQAKDIYYSRPWASPLKSRLERKGIVISDVQGSEAMRESVFEASRAYHLHHLHQCARTLRELEERKVNA